MAWHRPGDKSLSEPMLAQFTDAAGGVGGVGGYAAGGVDQWVKVAPLVQGQLYDCSSASEGTLRDVGKIVQ